jgi:hypothetical protein
VVGRVVLQCVRHTPLEHKAFERRVEHERHHSPRERAAPLITARIGFPVDGRDLPLQSDVCRGCSQAAVAAGCCSQSIHRYVRRAEGCEANVNVSGNVCSHRSLVTHRSLDRSDHVRHSPFGLAVTATAAQRSAAQRSTDSAALHCTALHGRMFRAECGLFCTRCGMCRCVVARLHV